MTGVIATIPRIQFSNALGLPLAGGKLYTYLAGTTTPEPTYQDEELMIANSNPVTLDATGSCVLWLDPEKKYKFLLKSALGVTQPGWPVDDISGPAVGAEQIPFIQQGIGAVKRTVQEKLRDSVSVQDFGAVGDGVTDDTAAIQRAIDFVKTKGWLRRPGVAGAQQGGIVFLPSGCYLISDPLVLPRSGLYDGSSVSLIGETMTSTVIQGAETFPANRGLIEWEAVAKRVYWQAIYDLTFLLPRTVLGVKAVHFVPVNGSTTASIFLEAMHGLSMRNITVDGTNTVNDHCIKFDGYVRYSSFKMMRSNLARGTNPVKNTVFLQFKETVGTDTSAFGESDGVGYSVFEQLYGMGEQGGYGAILRGRLYECTGHTILDGNGSLNGSPNIALVNSVKTTLSGIGLEGNAEQPQILIKNSSGITLRDMGVGGPNPGSTSHGITLEGSYNCLVDGRYTAAGTRAFSTDGGKVLRIDAACRNNKFTRFYLNANVESEVENLAPASARNLIEYYYPSSNLSGVRGLREGALLAAAESNAAQTINSGVFVPLVFGNETHDPLKVYDPATGLITAPVTGRYRITYTAYISGVVASKKLDVQAAINGNASTYIERHTTGPDNWKMLNGTVVVNATSGNTIGIGVQHDFGSAATLTQYALSATIAFEYLGE